MPTALDVFGTWWLPDDPQQSVLGLLRGDDKEATLELSGILEFPEANLGEIVQGRTVCGRDSSGRAITLLGATPFRGHGHEDEMACRSYTVLSGESHPEPSPEPLFGYCSFSLDGLAEWTEPHFRLLARTEDDGARRVRIDLLEGTVTLFSGLGERRSDVERVSQVDSRWAFEPVTPMSFDDLWRSAIRPLEYLHFLFTLQGDLRPFDARVRSADVDGPEGDLKVIAGWPSDGSPVPRRTWEWPIRLADIADRLPDVVRGWMQLVSDAEPAIVLLLSTLRREKDLYLENRYLSLAQAAEAFHRRHPDYAARFLSEDESEKRREVLKKVGKAEGWWDWLDPRTRYAYEPSFRQRIRELVESSGPFAARMFSSRSIDMVVTRRNELTHVLGSRSDSESRHAELAMLGEKIALLLLVCLLTKVGLDEKELEAMLRRNPHWAFVADWA